MTGNFKVECLDRGVVFETQTFETLGEAKQYIQVNLNEDATSYAHLPNKFTYKLFETAYIQLDYEVEKQIVVK